MKPMNGLNKIDREPIRLQKVKMETILIVIIVGAIGLACLATLNVYYYMGAIQFYRR